MFFRLLLAVGLVAAAGCSIKEDRSACLCHLTLELSRETVFPVGILVLSSDGPVVDTIIVKNSVCLDIPRKMLLITVSSGARPGGKDGFIIPEGGMCPEFLSWSGMVDARQEEILCRPSLRKHYCSLTIKLKGSVPEGNPFSIRLKGNYCGINLFGRPLEGAFLCGVGTPEDMVRIPRQGDGSLILQIVKDREPVHDFAIGEALVASGYDWLKEDLEDRTVEVDYAMNTVSLIECQYAQGPQLTLIL